MKAEEIAPAAMVTEAGTVALVELEARVTATPPIGAGPFRVIVPVDEPPPVTKVGERVSEVSVAAVMLRVAEADEVPNVADSVAVVDVATAVVVTVNVAVVAPAATVTVAGTFAMVELEVTLTAIPAVGAGLPRVTVPVAEVPPITDVGATFSDVTVGAVIVKIALWEAPNSVPETVAVADAGTDKVVTVKLAEVVPAATVTDAGTVALVALDARVTADPPVGAGPLSVTVPVLGEPPTTEVGERVSDVRVAAVMLSIAFAEELPKVAVRVADVVAETAFVETMNVAEVAPPATETVAGTVALVVLDARDTAIPALGAGLLIVTVPVALEPPRTDVGATVSDVTVGAVIVKAALAVVP